MQLFNTYKIDFMLKLWWILCIYIYIYIYMKDIYEGNNMKKITKKIYLKDNDVNIEF